VIDEERQRSVGAKRQHALVLTVSVAVHLAIFALALAAPKRELWQPWVPRAVSELIEFTLREPQEPAPEPAPASSGARGRADTSRQGNAPGDEGRSPSPVARRATLAMSAEPAAEPQPLAAPVQALGGPVGFGTDGDGVGGHGVGGWGPGGDGAGGDGDGLSSGVATDGWVMPDGCHNLRDDDGDHLTDWEDPECRPPPETPEEEVAMNTQAMLLSDMRSDDLPRGDPDELALERIQAQLRPSGGGLVYRGGQLDAAIGPDGDVRFGKTRSVGVGNGGMTFDLSGISRQRRGDRQKVQFLDATEELRAGLDDAASARVMAKALSGLQGELDEIWLDRRLSLLQKKAILFARLDECDLETEGGQRAAETIVAFIRAHSRPALDRSRRPEQQVSGAGRPGTLAR
jgi:hypothetical protein